MVAELVDDLEAVEEIAAAWDGLAVSSRAPVAAPAWGLAWWRHVAPGGLELRVVVVREGGRVIGVAPMYAERRGGVVAYRLLASPYASALSPLAVPGREYEVAVSAARALARAVPSPDRLDLGPVPAFSPWTAALREGWPTRVRPLSLRTRSQQVATVSLSGRTFEEWLAERDERVRGNARRRRRRFAEAGGTYRYATAATLRRDLETYAALHAMRWEGRGESRYLALGERMVPFFEAVGRPLVDQHRFRLLVLELAGEPICAEISLCAGGEVASVTVGWNPAHRRLGPARLALLHSIEEASRQGDRRIDLSWGNLEDKGQYANAQDALVWDSLVPPGSRLWRSIPTVVPAAADWRLRESVKRSLSEDQLDRLRAVRDRVARRRGSGR